jgi:hypothetical protein
VLPAPRLKLLLRFLNGAEFGLPKALEIPRYQSIFRLLCSQPHNEEDCMRSAQVGATVVTGRIGPEHCAYNLLN